MTYPFALPDGPIPFIPWRFRTRCRSACSKTQASVCAVRRTDRRGSGARTRAAEYALDKVREVIGVELVRREFLPVTAAVKRKVKTYRKQLRLLTNAQHRQSVCYSLYVRTLLRSVWQFLMLAYISRW